MLSKGAAAALLSLRNSHHGNAQWDDLQLDAFRSELNPGISADEAREAMRRFYASDHDGRWCGSGDINAIVRRMRNEAKPSEAQIGRECETRRLTPEQAWAYRRQRMLGDSPSEASRSSSIVPGTFPPYSSRSIRQGRSPLAIEATDTGQRHDPHRRRFTGTPSNLGSTPPAIIGGQA